MASASGTLCGVCETQDVVRDAIFWCPECDEGLCTSCEKHHRASKSSKNHDVTSANDYQQLPSSIANIRQYCPEHERKYQHYCSQHEKLCCPLCITRNHKTCDLMAIEKIIKTSKTSAFFDIMEQSIKDKKSNLERITDDRRKNLKDIHQQRKRFLTDIKEIRDKLNKHLDKLEQEIQQNIQVVEQKAKSKIDTLLSKISDHCKTIDKLQKNIYATKHLATDLQTFLGGKMFEAEIQKEEKFMQSFVGDGDLQQINLQCKIDDQLSKILSLTKMAEISIITNPPIIKMNTVGYKQAQQIVPKISKTINDINSTLLTRFEIQKRGTITGITGCTIMPSRRMVFVDKLNDRLVIHNVDGVFECEVPVSLNPIDVTYIDENTVAVTHNAQPYHIIIINIENKQIVKRIKTSNQCYGITNIEGRLIYDEKGSGIQTVDVNDERSVTTVVKCNTQYHYNYVATSKDKIYHTCPGSKIVKCYTVTGQIVWKYTDANFLSGIRGIIVDNDSNVYVISLGNCSVIVLSPDGKDARRLLGQENGIEQPFGIFFDRGRNILLVANHKGPAFSFNIK